MTFFSELLFRNTRTRGRSETSLNTVVHENVKVYIWTSMWTYFEIFQEVAHTWGAQSNIYYTLPLTRNRNGSKNLYVSRSTYFNHINTITKTYLTFLTWKFFSYYKIFFRKVVSSETGSATWLATSSTVQLSCLILHCRLSSTNCAYDLHHSWRKKILFSYFLRCSTSLWPCLAQRPPL